MVDETIDFLTKKAKGALDVFLNFDQKKIDNIVKSMAIAAIKNCAKLARLAVLETTRGIIEDKIIKNMFASEHIYNSIKNQKTVGIIEDNKLENYIDLADPIGIIAGVTPVTNPTSTTIFKALICIKTRNPIIFAFHPNSQKCCVETAEILIDAGKKAGAPEGFISYIKTPSIETTSALMRHSDISLILATGGLALVKAAYSMGKPALGVGPGNVPCYIEKTAKLKRACTDLIISKTFDNGMICASEQAVVVDKQISKEFENIMKENECVFLNKEETKKISDFVIDSNKNSVNPLAVGKSAYFIAKSSGIKVSKNTKILIAKLEEVGIKHPLSLEKLFPVLAYFVVKSNEEAFEKANKMLELGGLGHSACIHSECEEIIKKFGKKMRVGRIIVNSPSSHGAIGDIYNMNVPSLTLGCGSYGKNSTTSNISIFNLINKKKVVKRRQNVLSFKIPSKIYFGNNSVSYLKHIDAKRVFIITDKTMIKFSNFEKIAYFLKRNKNDISIQIFSDLLANSDIETILKSVKIIDSFDPDTIVAFGGKFVADQAKVIAAFHIKKSKKKIELIAVPVVSKTELEIPSFSFITGKKSIKYPIFDCEIIPNVAIIDSQFIANIPKNIIAEAGINALTHAIEAYVSVMANDYTDAIALKTIEIIFENLKRFYENEISDLEIQEKIHNALCMPTMIFSNEFLGINHSMACKLSEEHNISYGISNAILLPYVIKYNSNLPIKFISFPNYEEFIADRKYEKIARLIGVMGKDTKTSIKNLILEIKKLSKSLDLPANIELCGIEEKIFFEKLDNLSEEAHKDQCAGSNPKYPLIKEIKEIYKKAFKGI